jgi:short-subunit dehydrogenase
MMKLENRVAVITGAGGGIGRAIAVSLAKRACHVALADINEAGLVETQRLAQAHGVRASIHPLDVADREAVRTLPAWVMQEHGRCDVLVNNAGVAVSGYFEQVEEADFDWLMEINFHGLVRMTRAFLPLLRQSEEARLVNLSSLYGLVSPPGQVAYSSSKFAVRGFSNGLRHELANTHPHVGVTVVHPGGVKTAISASAKAPKGMSEEEFTRRKKATEKMLKMSPEEAGEIIVRGIEAKKDRVIVGSDAKFVAWLERLMPVGYWRVLGRAMKR